jgi:hypothetical protein
MGLPENLSADLYMLIPIRLVRVIRPGLILTNVLWLGTRYHGVFYLNGVVLTGGNGAFYCGSGQSNDQLPAAPQN